MGFFGTRNPRLPSSAALRFFRSTVLRFSYSPFCLPCCIRFFSKMQTRGRIFCSQRRGWWVSQSFGSGVPEFLNSLVLRFLKYGIRGTYRAHAKSSSSLELKQKRSNRRFLNKFCDYFKDNLRFSDYSPLRFLFRGSDCTDVGLSNILYRERSKGSSKLFFRREPGQGTHR